jgi:hypothetical protein
VKKSPLKQIKIICWHVASCILLSLLIIARAQSSDVSEITNDVSEQDWLGNFDSWSGSHVGSTSTNIGQTYANTFRPAAFSSETHSVLTYTLKPKLDSFDLFPDLLDSYLDEYIPRLDWLDELNTQWQAELGVFIVSNSNAVQTADTFISTSGQILSSEFNLGFRWGTSNLDTNSHFDSYSVLLGYGLADKVELNLGYSTLDVDERVYNSAFYEGTWYAGFSARF